MPSKIRYLYAITLGLILGAGVAVALTLAWVLVVAFG